MPAPRMTSASPDFPASHPTPTGQVPAHQALSFRKRIMRTVGLQYLLALPKGYDTQDQQRWPLILFLHGAGERGANLEQVKKHGIPRIVEAMGGGEKAKGGARGAASATPPPEPPKAVKPPKEFPFIAVSPQCPTDSSWNFELDALGALLDEIETVHNVDPDRIYVTGLSMGGYGTFALTAALPNRFAAAVPVCGGGDPRGARRMWHLPIWVFHGAKDPTVPLRRSAEMVEAIALLGGSPRFTVYPDATHDSWTETFNNPELYRWLLSHKRGAPRT